MKRFTPASIATLVVFSVICLVLRLHTVGWNLLIYCWLLIPYYAIHFWGQFAGYFRKNLSGTDRQLVYLSTILFLFITLFQSDFDDRESYYVIDVLLRDLGFHDTGLPTPHESTLTSVIIMCAADTIINSYLIVRSFKKRIHNSDDPQT